MDSFLEWLVGGALGGCLRRQRRALSASSVLDVVFLQNTSLSSNDTPHPVARMPCSALWLLNLHLRALASPHRSLHHDNITMCYGFMSAPLFATPANGEAETRPTAWQVFMVQEYCSGGTLAQALADGLLHPGGVADDVSALTMMHVCWPACVGSVSERGRGRDGVRVPVAGRVSA